MAVELSQIQRIITDITQEISQSYAELSSFFVIHKSGKMSEEIALAEHEISSHLASHSARAIIRKNMLSDKSSFLGLAIANESKFFRLKKRAHILAIFNINTDEFENEDEARAQIYHLAWHAIDLVEIRQQPKYRHIFKSGPMVPKRSDMNLAKAHLQADAFSIVLSALKKENNLLQLLSLNRAKNALISNHRYKPEDYASVVAMDSCKVAIEDILKQKILKKDYIYYARKFSIEVGHAFDQENIRQWWNFTIPAQDMAWRGFKKEEILGAAIHTSNDPYVRSIGFLIQEITNIEPSPAEKIENIYNAFIDPTILSSLHREMVDTIFEDAMTQGMAEFSNRPFLNAANQLNIALTEGHILGWCANALQDAAHAFERAILNGAPPDQAARLQFAGNKNVPDWDTLKKIGVNVINQKRQGFAVTMGHIAEICNNNPHFAPVLGSIKITLNDPAYIQSLEAANDFQIIPNMPSPRSAFEVAGARPKGPTYNAPAPMPQGPNLGGSNNASQLMRQRQMIAQNQAEEENTDNRE